MKTLKLLAVLLALFPLSQAAQAANVVNADFSAGLSGWTAQGTVNAASGYAALTAEGISTSGFGGTEGASLSQNIFVKAGSIVSFDYNFTTSDYLPFNDFALVVGDVSHLVSNVAALGNTNGNTSSTGWQRFSFVASSNFSTLMFLVSNVQDTNLDSTLFIDNVQVTSTPIPAAVWLFGSSLAGLMGFRRKSAVAPVAA